MSEQRGARCGREGGSASDDPFIEGRDARLYGKPRESRPDAEGSRDRAASMEAHDEAVDDREQQDTGTVDPRPTR